VLAEPVAGTLDLDDDGMVQQAIEQRRGDDGAAEDVAPFGEAAVRGQDHGTAFIPGKTSTNTLRNCSTHPLISKYLIHNDSFGRYAAAQQQRRFRCSVEGKY
jgi:hypothetical protein